ncbi:C6 zinc finger domain protein [Aspergillus homomorphus CBS 101889]|uniref:C6 zinc finger domain protein n=1 Tax=Aspergillus homomorphus (strain CBS 101889) TaxID=1450537 RepID=A0A395I6Q5_ASPHC|nr:C6 zinc finger domain protein [Aspergillus homomorphus CBS 101889]RAL15881.1 C6 zinc finger domain protein [Aspergillus homomorphus CBS 101889]
MVAKTNPGGPGNTALVPRRRSGGKRSATGCRQITRIRHKKCDEAPGGACYNCTSTGRRCDGYDLSRLPRASKNRTLDLSETKLVPGLTVGLHRMMNRDEQRCFAYFQYRTMPAMVGFFDSSLWQKLILQISHDDAAVYHAVVALSAFHQDSERQGMPLPKEDLGNTWHRFALEQSARSFALLSTRRASHDPRLREVTLLCCLVFVLLEWLRGQYDKAFEHLRSGVQILKELGVTLTEDDLSSTRAVPIDHCLVTQFAYLDTQSIQFGEQNSLVGDRSGPGPDQPHLIDTDTLTLQSIPDARQALNHILGPVMNLSNFAQALSPEQIAARYESLYLEQCKLCAEVDRFSRAFDHFRRAKHAELSAKEQRGADLIRLHQATASLLLETCFLNGNDPRLDVYSADFERILALVDGVIDAFPDRPSVCLDMGVIPPLFFVATGCSSYRLRRRAIQALRAWPHREGPWDSNLAARVATESMEVEAMLRASASPLPLAKDAYSLGGDIFSLRGIFVSVSEDQSHTRMSYYVGDEWIERWFRRDQT